VCPRRRVKDLDFGPNRAVVLEGKGDKDRRTVLPDAVKGELRDHLDGVRALHDRDLAEGFGEVYLPSALGVKYPGAAREWCWQYVFPSRVRSADPRSGAERRHHPNETTVSREVTAAIRRAGVERAAGTPGRANSHGSTAGADRDGNTGRRGTTTGSRRVIGRKSRQEQPGGGTRASATGGRGKTTNRSSTATTPRP
jgi:hypothetical protein